MLFVDRLVCYYGEKQSCGPISFSLKKGQALGVHGINGAGKSSLLRALAGIKPPTVQGEIQCSGGEKSRFLVPEGRHLFGSLSVKENLLVTSSFLPKKEREAAMEELFSELPILSELSNRPAGLLSGGQMQLVAVARALLAKPALLLVDEPFLGLSPGAREEVTSLLIAQKRKESASFSPVRTTPLPLLLPIWHWFFAVANRCFSALFPPALCFPFCEPFLFRQRKKAGNLLIGKNPFHQKQIACQKFRSSCSSSPAERHHKTVI